MKRKKFKNNNGFTLIELLAVIVILAVIALIAVPQVLRILKQARLSAAEDTTYGIVDSTNTYLAHLMLTNSGDLPISEYEFECDGTGCYLTDDIKSQLSGFQYEENLTFKGTIPKSGTVTVSENGTVVTATDLVINEFTCQYDNQIARCQDGNGTSTPVQVSRITSYGVTATTSSINISISAKNTETGFTKACHYLYDSTGNTEIAHVCVEDLNNINTYTESNSYTFNGNVEPGESYKVKTEMYMTATNILTSDIKPVTTLAIGQPVITSSPDGWAQSKTVTINYNGESLTNPEYYFYTSDTGTSNVTVVSCGNTEANPSTCDTNEVTNLSAGWYKTDGNVEITYTTEGQKTIKALTKDENGKSSQTASATITHIDVTPPTTPVISVTNTSDSITVTIDTVSTDASDVKYKYSKDNGLTWEPNDYTTNTTHTFSSVSEGSYNVIVKAVNETVTSTNNEENSNNTATTTAVPVTLASLPAFETDSWSTIKTNVTNNNTSQYNIGDTRCISLTGFTGASTDNGCPTGQFKIRLANKSTSPNCSNTSYSETACGFVVEFAENITTYNMNSSGKNSRGFPASPMYRYLQSDIYNALPSALQSAIKPTRVISGGGTNDSTTFTTTDVKLYLLSSVEVWGSTFNDNVTTSMTSQLEYYSDLEVTTSSYSGAIKKLGASNQGWWLRSAISGDTNNFIYVDSSGVAHGTNASNSTGVAPAFRIG